MKNFLLALGAFLALSTAHFPLAAQAADPKQPAPTPTATRSKQLSFDDSVVEGVNQNSKGSLENVEHNGGADRVHLYHKRPHYKNELQRFPADLGYSP